MARGQGAGKKGDPMVPVYSPHLRAAIADKRLRVTEVARRLKEHQQTVAYLAGGEGIKRCRRSRRARLAKLLGVSEQWLAEPTVMIMPLYPPAGSENVFFGTGFPPESPRAQLATTRLLTKCAQACERDLGDPTLRDAGRGGGRDAQSHCRMGTDPQSVVRWRGEAELSAAAGERRIPDTSRRAQVRYEPLCNRP